MARGLFVATEVARALVARFVRSCAIGVLLLLSDVLRRRHRHGCRRVRDIRRHLERRHGLLHRRMAEGVHVGYVMRFHPGDCCRVSLPATRGVQCRQLRQLGGVSEEAMRDGRRLPAWYER